MTSASKKCEIVYNKLYTCLFCSSAKGQKITPLAFSKRRYFCLVYQALEHEGTRRIMLAMAGVTCP